MIELVLPSPHPSSIVSAVSAQLTAASPYTLQWATVFPKIAPSRGGSGPPSNSWFLEPDRADSPSGIAIGWDVFAQVTLYFTVGALFPQNCPFPRGIWTPSNTRVLRSIRAHKLNGISIGSAVFAQMTAECPYTLQWDASFPLKIAPSHGRIWTPPSNTWLPWPTWVLNPNGISIGSVAQ